MTRKSFLKGAGEFLQFLLEASLLAGVVGVVSVIVGIGLILPVVFVGIKVIFWSTFVIGWLWALSQFLQEPC